MMDTMTSRSPMIRSQDQRRILQTNSHTFPTNVWIHKIKKKKDPRRSDLCKTLSIEEHRFKTEKDLPEQNLGHIQHTCEALSTAHIDAHHQWWRLIHGELTQLATPEWKFLCISERNVSRHYGMTYHPKSRTYSTWTSRRMPYGTLQGLVRWIVPSHRQNLEKSTRTYQRR